MPAHTPSDPTRPGIFAWLDRLPWPRETSIAFAAFLAWSLLYSHPLIFHLFDGKVVGKGKDWYSFMWDFWWVKHAVTTPGVDLFTNRTIFYPEGVSMLRQDFILLYGLLSVPLQLLFDLPTAFNLLAFTCFPLSAMGAYLLVRHVTGSHSGAFLAGFAYAFQPYLLGRPGSSFSLALAGWIPLFLLYVLRTFDEPGRKAPVAAAICMAAMVLSNLVYATFAGLVALLILAQRVLTERKAALAAPFLKRFGLMMGVTLALTLWYLIPFFAEFLTIDPAIDKAYTNLKKIAYFNSADASLERFFLPGPTSVFFPTSYGALGPGFVLMGLALWGWFHRSESSESRSFPHARVWAWSAVGFFILAQGPLLRLFGRAEFTVDDLTFVLPNLPFIAFHHLPFMGGIRQSVRLIIIVVLALGVLTGFGMRALEDWQTRRGWSVRPQKAVFLALLALIWMENWRGFPLPISDPYGEAPKVYSEIARDPTECTVLEIPTYRWHYRNQFSQSIHHKPILGGMLDRIPVKYYSGYFESIPVISLTSFPANIVALDIDAYAERARGIVPDVLGFFRVKYVVVHTDALIEDRARSYHVDPEDIPQVLAFVEKVLGGEKIYEDSRAVAYRVPFERFPKPEHIAIPTIDGSELVIAHPSP